MEARLKPFLLTLLTLLQTGVAQSFLTIYKFKYMFTIS